MKTSLILALTLLVSNISYAGFGFNGGKPIPVDGSFYLTGQSIAQGISSDGKRVVAGHYSGEVFNGTSYVLKTDTNGVPSSFSSGIGFDAQTLVAVQQPDGKILVGGNFTSYNKKPVAKLVRLNEDGTVDSTFNLGTGINNEVAAIALQSDGKIVIGGSFTSVNSITQYYISRLEANGAVDMTFAIGTGFNNTVTSLGISTTGKILAGGTFTSFNGTARNYVAQLNSAGTLDASFAPSSGPNGTPIVAAYNPDNTVIVAGVFSQMNGVARAGIAKLTATGSTDATFTPGTGFDSATGIRIAITSDSKIYAVGNFTTYGGVSKPRIVKILANGSADNSLNVGTGLNAQAKDVKILSDGKIIVTGFFTSYNGAAAAGGVKLNADGTYDTSFNRILPRQGPKVTVLNDDTLLFLDMSIALWRAATASAYRINADGTLDTSFVGGSNFAPGAGATPATSPNDIAIQADGKVVIVGNFYTYGGLARSGIVRLNLDGSVDTSFVVGSGLTGAAMKVRIQTDGKIVIGGQFQSYNGNSRNNLIRLNTDGSFDSSYNSGNIFTPSGGIYEMDMNGSNEVVIGGDFRTVGGVSSSGVARITSNGALASGWNPGTGFGSGTVYRLHRQADGKILAAGYFTEYNGVAVPFLIRINVDGTRDTTLNIGSGIDGFPIMTSTPKGDIILTGSFTTYKGAPVGNFMVISSTGAFKSSVKFDQSVYSAIYSPTTEKIYISGGFTKVNEYNTVSPGIITFRPSR